MSVEENKALVLRYFREVVNKHDLSSLEAIFSPQFLDRGANEGLPAGPEASRRYNLFMFKIFPDVHDDIEAIIATDEYVAVRVVGQGTHAGERWGVSPTGKQIIWTATMIWQIAEGKIKERWMTFDALSQMIQLGVIPPLKQVIIPSPNNIQHSPTPKQHISTTHTTLQPLLRFIEALRTGDITQLKDIFSPTYLDHGGWIDDLSATPEQEVTILRTAFPDLEVTVDHMFATGNFAVLRATASGTHQGSIFGLPATNKRATWMTIGIYQIEEGKIQARWLDASRRQLVQQISSFPFPD